MNISSTTYNNYQTGLTINSHTGIPRNQEQTGAQPAKSTTPVVKTAMQPVEPDQSTKQNNTFPNPDTKTAPATKSEPNSQTPESSGDQTAKRTVNGKEFEPKELQLIEALKQADAEVRRHEMAHIAAGGQYITSGANFSYKRGPDGKNYAVAGEVGIDTSPIPGDPQATIRKMRQIKSSALAPASPSPQDLRVAAKATASASKASSELMILQAQQQASANEEKAFGDVKKAADTYEKVNDLPEGETSSFEIAV